VHSLSFQFRKVVSSAELFRVFRDNNTTEKFRGRFDRHDSQVLAPRGLISINCRIAVVGSSVLQGGNSARRMRGYDCFLRKQCDTVLYTVEERVNVTATCISTGIEDRNDSSNRIIFEKIIGDGIIKNFLSSSLTVFPR